MLRRGGASHTRTCVGDRLTPSLEYCRYLYSKTSRDVNTPEIWTWVFSTDKTVQNFYRITGLSEVYSKHTLKNFTLKIKSKMFYCEQNFSKSTQMCLQFRKLQYCCVVRTCTNTVCTYIRVLYVNLIIRIINYYIIIWPSGDCCS